MEFFYSLAPPGFEPGTSCILAERATDVAMKTERFWAKNVANKLLAIKSVVLKRRSFFARNLSDFVATSVARSARVREVPGSNPSAARV